MKGINEFYLNEATMVDIVQYWIDKKIPADTPNVTKVKFNNTVNSFIITLVEQDSEGVY
jgi:hypothetical protein